MVSSMFVDVVNDAKTYLLMVKAATVKVGLHCEEDDLKPAQTLETERNWNASCPWRQLICLNVSFNMLEIW